MTIRKRRQPTPANGLPPPYDPITGKHAPLVIPGESPYCAMMQIAAEDTHDNYVVCRGYDTRVKRFFDYVEGDPDQIGISVAKPYGNRVAGAYSTGQVYAAMLPLGRLGQTPGVAAVSSGHPADLDEVVDILYDDNDIVINWMLVDSGVQDVHFELKTDLDYDAGATGASAYLLTWDADNNTWDTPEDEDTVITVFDPDVDDGHPLRGLAGKADLSVLSRGVRGIAKRAANGNYEITQLFHKAKHIEFTLGAAALTTADASSAGATVDNFFDGINPDPGNDKITVYNKLASGAAYIFEGDVGDKGIAVHDDRADRYLIIQMECP